MIKRIKFFSKQVMPRLLILTFFITSCFPTFAFGQTTADDLRAKIDQHNKTIEQLEKEIDQYQQQVNQTAKQAQTLQNTVQQLDLTDRKLSTTIQVTQTKIDTAALTIAQLGLQISDKDVALKRNETALKETLQTLYQTEQQPLIETLIEYKGTGSFWDQIERLAEIRNAIRSYVSDIKNIKTDLQNKKSSQEDIRKQLLRYQSDLADQQKLVQNNKLAKAQLLAQTKNKESNYKKILEQKIATRDAFAKELLDFESQLQFQIDLSKIPGTGSHVLSWPLDQVSITQYFGNTSFAIGRYNGQGHNGIDLRASFGTPVKSAAPGVIVGTGDTDLVCPGASYGRWILIRHYNGLSTLYGHLSVIKVSAGQTVDRGELIAYSGSTGYATGPHLHFTVAASDGIRILSKRSQVCNGVYTMPIADLKAYLNPLSYL